MTSEMLSCIEMNPLESPRKLIIWLHGLGADAEDFIPVANELNVTVPFPIRFLFPNAPFQSITVSNGAVMRAWYDIYSFSGAIRNMDEKGVVKSILSIQQLIEAEVQRGFSLKDIILAGFSQGAVIALSVGLSYENELGGVIALSGYLPHIEKILKEKKAPHRLPIFLAHGMEDEVVPFSLGEAIYHTLKKYDYPVAWHTYSMAHHVCAKEVRDIADWLTKNNAEPR